MTWFRRLLIRLGIIKPPHVCTPECGRIFGNVEIELESGPIRKLSERDEQ